MLCDRDTGQRHLRSPGKKGHSKTFWNTLQLANGNGAVTIPVNPYSWSKSVEHDVTLTLFIEVVRHALLAGPLGIEQDTNRYPSL